MPWGKAKEAKLSQPLKAEKPIESIFSGVTTETRLTHPLNIALGIIDTLSPNTTLRNVGFSLNGDKKKVP